MISNPAWVEPLKYAEGLKDEENLILLYSGMAPGRYSLLAWDMEEQVDNIEALETKLTKDKIKFQNSWIGYLGYGLRNQFEDLPRDDESFISLPDMLMGKFRNIILFDHEKKAITATAWIKPESLKPISPVKSINIRSNMTDAEYLEKAATVIKKIHQGELYQANLTRKFAGEFVEKPDTLGIFAKLAKLSPAPYSAYLKFGDIEIISASPEKFLTVENGIATTEPIKGTLAAEKPAALLAESEKDRAENLMIVDLMRNDLARSCTDVKVEKLFHVTSYSKYHHMSSTITGKLKTTALDVVKTCFPPGSMTGAPKIQAMKLCSELEKNERGIYSGAIGYFGGDGSADLSVVIRTIVIKGNKFEFQSGGGIVADSTPEKELEELNIKTRAIREVLGI